ncbi:hypothetical protein J421_4219 [Gemmatirosa kalamazoonensis]|uniref:Polymer-forming cytoskeletal protein n=1 Tax=Gemmatirosa kalamazoonensis TaxID=861299 RepID=W0RLY5_9BACT|nr:polymer-forming cytoskeletal protein [Gemmatirosa kalamazoonensis]AHG91756.1 hypothetical protein J421_4219 [Gemmatirosa kalamazoonensis]
MTGLLPFLVLLLGTCVWALLPFVPAVRELLRPTDAVPLGMVGRDSGDITYFATGFRAFLERHPILSSGSDPANVTGTLADGAPYARVATPGLWTQLPRGEHEEITAVVVLDGRMAVPPSQVFAAEVYARQPMLGGVGTTYRAVLCDDVCHLLSRSVVLRWIHARRALCVGRGSTLYNRASSDDRITLSSDVRFDRLGAPIIEVAGDGSRPSPPTPTRTPYEPPSTMTRVLGEGAAVPFYRVEGDFVLPEATVLRGNVVVRGTAVVQRGARLEGSLKAHRDVRVEAGGEVTDALVSRRDVTVEEWGVVGGPLVAERDCALGRWSRVGDVGSPTTIACRRLTLSAGCRVHGRVSTRGGGTTGVRRPAATAPASR